MKHARTRQFSRIGANNCAYSIILRNLRALKKRILKQFKKLEMCLYPKFIKNKRYLSYITKQGKWHEVTEKCKDYRKLYVPIGCGECRECKKQKAQAWRVRLMEEYKAHKYSYFMTLTFSDEELQKLRKELKTDKANEIATKAVRRFLERWRAKYGKSLRHWLVTELGEENDRIHLHGIFYTEKPHDNEEFEQLWKYGITYTGEYCNQKTINYIVKYITKTDPKHKEYKSIVLCSAGIGANFVESATAQNTYKYKKGKTPEYYTLNNGYKVALPIYYRNKLYTQKERDQLWTERLDKNTIYVNGIEIKKLDTKEGYNMYMEVLAQQQYDNINLGFGNRDWKKTDYTINFNKINQKCSK